jgi:antitoxin VapB
MGFCDVSLSSMVKKLTYRFVLRTRPTNKIYPSSSTLVRGLHWKVSGIYHMMDTTKSRRLVMAVAKVFRTGRSQAIRLPKEFRVEADTVQLKRTGEGFLVITKDPWEIFFEGVEQLSDKFLGNERVQPE